MNHELVRQHNFGPKVFDLESGKYTTAAEFLNEARLKASEDISISPLDLAVVYDDLDPKRTRFFSDGAVSDSRIGDDYDDFLKGKTDLYTAYIEVFMQGMVIEVPYESRERRSEYEEE